MIKKNQLGLNFLICFFGWGIPMGFLCSLLFGSFIKGFVLGMGGGIFFAGIMVLFIVILHARKDKLRERYGIEGTVLYDGVANHRVKKEIIGGWIFLMEDRLYFVSHAINSTVGEWSVPYSDIVNVTKGKRIRSIAIHLRNGEIEEFIVNHCNEWIKILNYKI